MPAKITTAACFVALSLGLLTACGSESDVKSSSARTLPDSATQARQRGALPLGSVDPASCVESTNLDGGRSYHVVIPSRVDNEPISFQVFEPDRFDCEQRHPLVLEGHGYSGSRQTEKSGDGAVAQSTGLSNLTAAGYVVISIDQRGSGDSGGTVRVMDPDFEGQDLIAIVDWAEQHLDYLKYRDNNLLLGGIGSSYGGGFQMLLLAIDPSQRFDAIVPEITWHDLSYSLAPNGVVKSYWALALGAAGDAGTQGSQDPFIRAALLEGSVTGVMPEALLPFLRYHSPSYFCENPTEIAVGDEGSVADFLLGPILNSIPLTAGSYRVGTATRKSLPTVDALIFQGPRDDLFNLNEAYKNYQCLKRAGGDVRLLSYEFGHGVLAPDLGLVQQTLEAQTLPIGRNCGPINANQAAVAWFNEKLLGKGSANEVIQTASDICLSLTQSDAVAVTAMPVGGETFPVQLPGGLPVPVTLGQLAPTIVPLMTISNEREVIAGIPQLNINVGRGNDALDGLCQTAAEPLLRLGSCDSTVFVGLGVIPLAAKGSRLPLVPELLDEQVLPIRGFGQFELEMVGVAERLVAGDQLVLMLYGNQQGFVATSSRDLSAAIVTVSGTVSVPMLGNLPSLGD